MQINVNDVTPGDVSSIAVAPAAPSPLAGQKRPLLLGGGGLFHTECPVEGSASLRKIVRIAEVLLINLGSTYIHGCLSKYNRDSCTIQRYRVVERRLASFTFQDFRTGIELYLETAGRKLSLVRLQRLLLQQLNASRARTPQERDMLNL